MKNMKKHAKLALLAAVAGVVLLLAGCPQQVSIGDITRDPGAYMNKEVTVVGTVNNSYWLLGNAAYQLSDDTGSIWVLSAGPGIPSGGTLVGVPGQFIPTLTFAAKSYT